MQKNLPKYAPDWIRTTTVWANASKREVHYPVCDDRRTLVWLANQRAVEYHPALNPVEGDRQTHLILDLDPPDDVDPAQGFRMAVAAALLVRQALDDSGLTGGVKTSGAKGVHVFVPLTDDAEIPDVAAATRALAARATALDTDVATTEFVREERGGKVFVDSTRAGGATVVAAYSPRARPGVPVSFPVTWAELEQVRPSDFTIVTALDRLADRPVESDPWAAAMAEPQRLPHELVAEGHDIPIARVLAMHEGKRRKRAQELSEG
jgi:DNA ligase D-like protein (predicted polymerase)